MTDRSQMNGKVPGVLLGIILVIRCLGCGALDAAVPSTTDAGPDSAAGGFGSGGGGSGSAGTSGAAGDAGTGRFQSCSIVAEQTHADPASAPGVVCNVVVNATGLYRLNGRVVAETEGSNSFFLNANAEPTGQEMTWDIHPLTNGPETRTVTWRGGGTHDAPQFAPVQFDLKQGTNKIYVRAREEGTRLEAFEPVPVGSGGTGDGGTSGQGGSGGGSPGICSPASHLEAEGLTQWWCADFSGHVGDTLTKEIFFGSDGLDCSTNLACGFATPTIGDAFHTIGHAPDGTLAIQYNVPQGVVPDQRTVSYQFPTGEARAGLAVDVWVPDDFEWPSECGEGSCGSIPGQGRWPIGMWIGTDPTTSPGGGGQPVAQQSSLSIRLNRARSASGDPQAGSMGLYVYNLNREPGKCEAADVCSANCAEPSVKCYGSGGQRSAAVPRGRWFTVEIYVAMNQPGQEDGRIALWVDGQLVDDKTGYDLGASKGWAIRGVYTYNLWHCNGSSRQQNWWQGNWRLYRG